MDTTQIGLGLDMDTNILNEKRCPSMMVLISIKQHLSNIRSSVYKKVKQHWGLVEKKTLLIRKSVYLEPFKHLRWSFFRKMVKDFLPLAIFPKTPIKGVWQSLKYAFVCSEQRTCNA